MESHMMLVVYSLLFYFIPTFNTLDTIAPGKFITGNETLVSADGSFEAGFFLVGDLQNQFMGIWYKNISPTTYVWVANRDAPLRNSSGELQVTNGGILIIVDGRGATIWSSNASITSAANPIVQLMNSGNLVVKDANKPDKVFWQSFDYPGNTLLPGMILRSNISTGQYTSMTCWRNGNDPSPGDYSFHIDIRGFPQAVITKGGEIVFRLGPWNGIQFSGVPWGTLTNYLSVNFVFNPQGVTLQYGLNSSIVTMYVINPNGLLQRFVLSDQTHTLVQFASGPGEQCDNYAKCGANSNCNSSSNPPCECLKGFIPKSPERWNSSTWSDGCLRRSNLDCDDRDGFLRYTQMKLPDTSSSWFDRNMDLEECKKECLKNCSCTAYANLDIRDGGSGCLIWLGDIMDMRRKTTLGQNIYIRVAASDMDPSPTKNNRNLNKKHLAGILVGSIMGMIILGVTIYLWRKKIKRPGTNELIKNLKDHAENRSKEEIDISTFDLSTIVNATSNFSVSNKLGEGGFGTVYKGVLENEQEIAVKRLSKNSRQGAKEFKNEIVLIANLQHRNLVKLLGCCNHGDERMLIYEFMPNRSLDYFIFDKTRSNTLHWIKRFQIINGIVRGLLYLHQDSRLTIIHRDLKTSNILLDKNMNPKISDFGIARLFGEEEAEANTTCVMGTHGYMPPEYVVHGSFSAKSDVFSFGVIVLEIICGRKNRTFYDSCHHVNLIGHAWRLWSKNRPLELIDESLGDSIIPAEVIRCIHIGLLCVQERPEDRPDMSSVVLMLNGEKPLLKPREPGFYPHEECFSSSEIFETFSTNEVSVSSLLTAR